MMNEAQQKHSRSYSKIGQKALPPLAILSYAN